MSLTKQITSSWGPVEASSFLRQCQPRVGKFLCLVSRDNEHWLYATVASPALTTAATRLSDTANVIEIWLTRYGKCEKRSTVPAAVMLSIGQERSEDSKDRRRPKGGGEPLLRVL